LWLYYWMQVLCYTHFVVVLLDASVIAIYTLVLGYLFILGVKHIK